MTDVKAVSPWIDVVVGVIINEEGHVLLASRPEGKPYAGYWEFPGGKVEKGETAAQTLKRELMEELGLQISDSIPWFVATQVYEHGRVRLHFRRSRHAYGTPQAKEKQQFGYFSPFDKMPGTLLPLVKEALHWSSLPDVYEDSVHIKVLTLEAHRSTIVRDRKSPYVGARIETFDDAMKAKAMGYDFAIVKPDHFEAVLQDGEALLPLYVEGGQAKDLDSWQARGAHGVKPNK